MWEIHNEDCRNYLEKTNRIFDLVITSPPYGSQKITYDTYKDNGAVDLINLFNNINTRLRNKTKNDSFFFLQMGPNRENPMLPFKVIEQLTDWDLINQIMWIKSGTFPTPDAREFNVGHYTPINSKLKLHSCWEYVFMLARKDRPKELELDKLALGTEFTDKSNISRWKNGKTKRCRGNMWFVPYSTKIKRNHPCPFPYKLVKNCIQISGKPKDSWVFDPFMGEGNTGIACKNLGMNFVGCDISPQYCEFARKNLEQ